MEKFTIGKWSIEKTPAQDRAVYRIVDTSVAQGSDTDWQREFLANRDYITPDTPPAEVQKKWDAWAEGEDLRKAQKQGQTARLVQRELRKKGRRLGLGRTK